MADTTFKAPTATGGKNNSWTDPTNAYADDTAYATRVDDSASYIYQSYEAFDFGIPANSVINGIEASIKGKASADNTTIGVELYATSDSQGWGGTKLGTFNIAEATVVLGDAADKWFLNWVSTDFSNANFSVRVFTNGQNNSRTLSLNLIQVKVTYTTTSASSSISSSVSSSISSSVSPSSSISSSVSLSISSSPSSSISSSLSSSPSSSISSSVSSSISTSISSSASPSISPSSSISNSPSLSRSSSVSPSASLSASISSSVSTSPSSSLSSSPSPSTITGFENSKKLHLGTRLYKHPWDNKRHF